MPTTLTLNFSDKPNVQGSLKVESENVIKKIFLEYSGKSITSTQFEQLQKIAQNSGNADVLEVSDISNGKNKLKAEITKGNASFGSGLFNAILGGNYKGDIYVNVPKGTAMSTIKKMYNLPDGALANYCQQAGCPGGNKDNFLSIGESVWFSATAFAKGNNMTLEEVEALFNEK